MSSGYPIGASTTNDPWNRKIGLASGVIKGTSPVDTIKAAAAGGWDMVGLWVEPEDWTDDTTTAVLTALKETRIPVIDVEVIRIKPGSLSPSTFRTLDIGIAVGAANALVISEDPDREATAEKLRALCQHVEGNDIRVAFEFGRFSAVPDIKAASVLLDAVDHPSAALLVDTLHLARSGGTAADVAAVDPSRISYAQVCDAPAVGPSASTREAFLEEAVWDRLQVGEGGLDVAGMIAALPPGIPLSVEIRSRALNERFPDAVARSKVTAEATRRFMTQQQDWQPPLPLSQTPVDWSKPATIAL